ncbi:myosin heavy chain, fast skeletal muscle-like [Mangifera indica]|uniref:myosin heavy chain, fast skeletal muscle-like n=1 Tax=Mangifera indica TaxID=29780 RepID=UPI001CF9AB32|nr:myosin heavy chain, fast skeletal muscle-like [Mangifera indica]
MFKSWRKDKDKFKAVFKLQFQATQVPPLKKSAVMISLVPEDVGKTAFKMEKVAVQDGTCLWERPIYVTVKLTRDSKTGKIHEKIYHFVVSSGSSKSDFLGEASIDLADFAAETEPLTVSLPLKFANSGAILHLTIEKIHGATDLRAIEGNGDNIPSLKNQENNIDGVQQNFEEDKDLNIMASQNDNKICSLRASTGSAITLASIWDSDSEQNIQLDPASIQSPVRQNSMPPRGIANVISSKKHSHRRSNTDWSVGSVSDGSLVDSTNSLEDTLPRDLQDVTDGSVSHLKSELAIMMRQVELSELELQTLRKQVVKENKRMQDQSKQIAGLIEEREELKTECEQLRRQNSIAETEVESELQAENDYLRVAQEEIREELNHQKEINANFRLQLQKTQDSNTELILVVKDLNEMLEQKNKEISALSSKVDETSKFDENLLELEAKIQNNEKEAEMLKQKIIDQSGEIEFYRKHSEELEMHAKKLTKDCDALKQENQHLSSKLEENQLQESMKTSECLELLATVEELKSQVERLEDKIKQQSQEYSESLIAINERERQVKEFKQELVKQAQEFEDNLDVVSCAKTEQEQRAIRAEEALKKTRWKNAVTAERLQEEFKRLSVEMASKIDDSEKVATKAMTESNELLMQKKILEEMLQKAKDELGLIKNQNGELSRQIEQMSLEINHKSDQQEASSMEIQTLRTEIENLKREKHKSSDAEKNTKLRGDVEQQLSVGETDILIRRWNKEKDDLEKKFALAKKEAEKAHKEFILMKSLKDEKEMMIGNLQSEVKTLRVQQSELKSSLTGEELEKDNLRKQVIQLKNELQKKEERITSIEKKFKNYSNQASISDMQIISSLKARLGFHKDQSTWKEAATETPGNPALLKENNLNIMIKELVSIMEQVDVPPFDGYKYSIRKDEMCSKKGLKSPTSHSRDAEKTELLTQVTILKEKNKCIETELKEMQERYSEISLKFAEVEGERQELVMTVRNLKNGKKN